MQSELYYNLTDNTDKFFREGVKLTHEKKEEIIVYYAPLVHYVASRLAGRLPPHILAEDLMGAGVTGLIDAVEKFDPAKKIKFKTYAEFRIRGAILDELRALDWVPRSVRQKATELEYAFQELEKRKGRPAEDEEVAAFLNIPINEFYKLIDQTRGITFIDIDVIKRRMQSDIDSDLFDLIEDDATKDPYNLLDMMETKEYLIKAISKLPEKEKLVISLYYYEDLTMREIGEIMGYTESRISQMHAKAMLRLRGRLHNEKKNNELLKSV